MFPCWNAHADNLINKIRKDLPQEIDSAHGQVWDAVLVNKYLCELRVAKKLGRKERKHKEAQAVLAAATAAAAASSRISSVRKDLPDGSTNQEVIGIVLEITLMVDGGEMMVIVVVVFILISCLCRIWRSSILLVEGLVIILNLCHEQGRQFLKWVSIRIHWNGILGLFSQQRIFPKIIPNHVISVVGLRH